MGLFSSDAAAVGISAAVLLSYYVFVVLRLGRDPAATVHAVNRKARLLWVRGVMRDRSKDVMAVQTLRNYVMAATFMASSAALFIIGTLTLSGQMDSLSRTWDIFGSVPSSPKAWAIVKIMCLLTALIVAFFAFAMVIRSLNHVLFMIGLPAPDACGSLAPDAIALRLNYAGTCYSVGVRAFFLTVPFVFWLFGPPFLIASTVGTMIVFYLLDKSPISGPEEAI